MKRQRRECVFLKKRWAAAVAVSMLLSLGSVMAAAADETEAVQTENTTSERETAENGTAENTAGQTAETPETDPGNEETGTWKQEDGGWRYYGEDGTYKKTAGNRLAVTGTILAGMALWPQAGRRLADITTASGRREIWQSAGAITMKKKNGIISTKTALRRRAGFRMKTGAGTGFPREERWPLPDTNQSTANGIISSRTARWRPIST